MTSVAAPEAWRRDDVAVALALAVLAFVLAAGGWLWRADRLVYDAGLSLWTRPAPDDVVIVAIDDASVEAIGRWPWRRSVHATLLERLAQARPRAVVLDLLLSEPDPDPRQDELLADALRRTATAVMPVAWQALPGEPLRLLEPVASLRSAVRLGAAEAAVDDDGVLRHAFLEAGPPQQTYPHLAVAALAAGGQGVHARLAAERVDGNQQAAGWPRQGRFLIRYDGPPGHVRRLSYVDVLRGAVPAGQLAGHYVLVGMTAQGLGDTLATPVNARQHAMPGVEVLAHTLSTLRSGQAPRAVPALLAGLLSALGAAGLVAAFVWAGTRPALVLALLSLPVALLVSLLALAAGLWWSPASFMLAAVVAYPLWSWRRLERSVADLDREIARLDLEPGLLPAAASAEAPARDRLAQRLAALHTAAETLRSARRFLADALAGLPTALLVDDGFGRVLLANPPAAQLFEVDSADDLRGLDLARLLGEFECQPALDWPLALADVRRTRQGLAVQARLAGQGDHVIHAHGVPMHGGTRLIVAMADVAPIKQAERAREELLAFVSHDLRSPATSIVLLAEMQLAGRGTLGPEALMHEVRRLAQRTLSLADDFVRVAQATQRPLQCELRDPQALLVDAMADCRPQAEAAAVRLHLQPVQVPPAPVTMDAALVLRAIGNLLSNAVKNSPPGAVVTVSALPRTAGGCVIQVADQGPGLDATAIARLQQAHDGLVPADGRGVGFGLLFVQRVAARHGGRLLVRAGDAGRGALFELEIGHASGNP